MDLRCFCVVGFTVVALVLMFLHRCLHRTPIDAKPLRYDAEGNIIQTTVDARVKERSATEDADARSEPDDDERAKGKRSVTEAAGYANIYPAIGDLVLRAAEGDRRVLYRCPLIDSGTTADSVSALFGPNKSHTLLARRAVDLVADKIRSFARPRPLDMHYLYRLDGVSIPPGRTYAYRDAVTDEYAVIVLPRDSKSRVDEGALVVENEADEDAAVAIYGGRGAAAGARARVLPLTTPKSNMVFVARTATRNVTLGAINTRLTGRRRREIVEEMERIQTAVASRQHDPFGVNLSRGLVAVFCARRPGGFRDVDVESVWDETAVRTGCRLRLGVAGRTADGRLYGHITAGGADAELFRGGAVDYIGVSLEEAAADDGGGAVEAWRAPDEDEASTEDGSSYYENLDDRMLDNPDTSSVSSFLADDDDAFDRYASDDTEVYRRLGLAPFDPKKDG